MSLESLSIEQLNSVKVRIKNLLKQKELNIIEYLKEKLRKDLTNFDNGEHVDFINTITYLDVTYRQLRFFANMNGENFIFQCFPGRSRKEECFGFLYSKGKRKVNCNFLKHKTQYSDKLPISKEEYDRLLSFAKFLQLYRMEKLRAEFELLEHCLHVYPILETREACFTFMLCCKRMNICKDIAKLISEKLWERRYEK